MVSQPNLVSGCAFIPPITSVPNFKAIGLYICVLSHLYKKKKENERKLKERKKKRKKNKKQRN